MHLTKGYETHLICYSNDVLFTSYNRLEFYTGYYIYKPEHIVYITWLGEKVLKITEFFRVKRNKNGLLNNSKPLFLVVCSLYNMWQNISYIRTKVWHDKHLDATSLYDGTKVNTYPQLASYSKSVVYMFLN